MNIINHLTETVTPKVITNSENISGNHKALLEKFYSIVLVRLSHEQSYNKLTEIANKRKGKKAGIIKYADFVYKLAWTKEQSSKKTQNNKSIVTQLAENHEVSVSDVKRMFREAMPLVVEELRTLSNQEKHKNVPLFLQEILVKKDKDTDILPVIDYVPQWGMVMFPSGVINADILGSSNDEQLNNAANSQGAAKTKSNDESDKDSNTEASKTDDSVKKQHTAEIKEANPDANNANNTTSQAADNKTGNKEITKNAQQDTSADGSKDNTETANEVTETTKESKNTDNKTDVDADKIDSDDSDTDQQRDKKVAANIEQNTTTVTDDNKDKKSNTDEQVKQDTQNKKLPEPVHVAPPPPASLETEQLDHKTDYTDTINSDDGKSKFLVIMPVVIILILCWGVLKGCQANKKTRLQESIEENKAAAIVKNSEDYMPAVLSVEVGNDGKLQATKMVSGSKKLDNQVKSALIDVFGDVSVNSAFEINDSMLDDMPVGNRLNDLLILVKSVPNSSMTVIGNEINFTAADAQAKDKLVVSAQALLPSFTVTSEINDNLAINSNQLPSSAQQPTNQSENQQQTQNTEQTTLTAEAAANNSSKNNNPVGDAANSTTDNAALNTTAQPANQQIPAQAPVLDIKTTVSNSIKESNTALDKLAKKDSFTKDELSAALNLQIINFATNSASIPEDNQKILIKAAKLLDKLPESRVRIIGHTDASGDDEYNKRLSNDRAYAVKKFLMKQGIPSIHMKEVAMGESKPIASNKTAAGRFRNRRIEFIVKQAQPATE